MLILKQLARDYNITQAELANILNVRQPDVSRMMSGLREIRPEHIALLEQRFGKDVVASYDLSNEQYEEWRNRASKAIQATIIPAEIVEEIKEEALQSEGVPMLPEVLSSAGDVNVRAYIEENGDELELYNPALMLKDADLAEKVRKTSMLPIFAPDDVVFVSFLNDKSKIVDGEYYYMDIKARPTMIRKVKIEGDHYRLVASNPDFADIIIEKRDIINVAAIVGLFRATFNDYGSQIANVRKQKDAQIDHLIGQLDKFGERENRLIDMLEKKINQ